MVQMRRFVPEGVAHLELPMSTLIGLWKVEHGLLLNPRGDVGTTLTGIDVRALPEARELGVELGADESRFEVGRLDRFDPDVAEPIEVFSRESRVVSAVHAARLVDRSDPDESRVGVALELDEAVDSVGFMNDAHRRLARAVKADVTMVVVLPGAASNLARTIVETGDVIWRRQRATGTEHRDG